MQQTTSEHVAAAVRAEMARKRISQGVLAYELGITQQSLSRRLTGKVPFDVDELATAAAVLGVDVSDLLPRAEQIA